MRTGMASRQAPKHPSTQASGEGWCYLAVSLLIFCYILARAILVPFVHDEAATFSMYVQFGEFLPWRSHWDAGNHYLNTALGIIGNKLFGMEQWAVRGGNVLAFVLYAWMVRRIGDHVRDRLVRWCMWLAMLLCPFLLEFFSLFRGYGLEMAFLLWGLNALLCFVRVGGVGQFVQVLLALCLANASILALLPFWGIMLGLLALMIATGTRATKERLRLSLAWLFLGLLPLLLGARIAVEMQEIGLLYYGNMQGFIPVTIATLCRFVLGNQHPMVIGAIIALFIAMTAIAGWTCWRERSWQRPLPIMIGVLWAEVAARVIMADLLGVNYPEDRAALHMVPLFLVAMALSVDVLATRKAQWRWAALPLLLLPLRALVTANADHTSLWPDESPPPRFIDRLLTLQADQERPLVIGCYRLMSRSLSYKVRLRGHRSPIPHTEGFPEGPHDVRVVRDDHLVQALQGFHEVDHDPGTGLHLLERNTPLRLQLMHEDAFAAGPGDQEFLEIVRLDTLAPAVDLLVEVEAELITQEPAAVKLVVEVRDSTDKAIYYDAAMITAFAPLTDHVREVRRIPALPDGYRAVVYFWNARRTSVALTNGSVRVLRVTGTGAKEP